MDRLLRGHWSASVSTVYPTVMVKESDLIRDRTREGLRVARAEGRLRGKPPKLDPAEQARLVELHHSEDRSPEELAEMFGVARSTVYRVLERARRGAIEPVSE